MQPPHNMLFLNLQWFQHVFTIRPYIVNISALSCQGFLQLLKFISVSAGGWVETATALDVQIDIKTKVCQ